jgi:parvulin-like peptidyl-prolyl isomerase
MVQPPKKSQPVADPAPRRVSPRKQREMRRQRLVVISSAAAIGLALIAVLAGVLYDQVYIPSQPIARVNGQSLSRQAYWDDKRHQLAASISQALFLTSFGQQFAQQVLSQISSVNTSLETLRSDPVEETAVDTWIDRQIVIQGAQKMGVQVSEGEIAQLIDANYGPAFGPTTETTSTMSLTPVTLEAETDALTPTVTLAPSATVAAAPAATAQVSATGGLTPTAALTPTATLAPTETPTVTPQPDQALARLDEIYNRLFDTYVQQLAQVDPSLKSRLSVDDFRAGLHDQFQRQTLALKVQEQLVPDSSFTPTTEPSSIDARHILVAVTVPVSATDDVREAAFAERRAAAQALLDKIRAGTPFEQVARESSDDYGTRADGGQLPGFKPNGETTAGTQIDPAIIAAIAPLKDNEVSDLVRTPFGWHIVQLIKRNVDSREDQLRSARTKAFDTWLEEQRKAATIEHFPPVSPTPTPLPTGTALPLPTADLAASPSPTPEPTLTPAATVAQPEVTGTPAPAASPTPTP